eukprot:TRINITY_DN4057_c0_g1_i2.p1 TRINITY_DN4057_c0_g1~~TRINITY_DN4057_c0_g1_i2.p1  ORF type:complete len:304 (+),score=49.95 TRINITY_DN4057_c0_g1_i2:86-913(+)
MLQIYLRPQGGAACHAVELAAEATVRNLQRAAQDALGGGDHIELSFSGAVLTDGDALLADLGICPESEVQATRIALRWRTHPGCRIPLDDDCVTALGGRGGSIYADRPCLRWRILVKRAAIEPGAGTFFLGAAPRCPTAEFDAVEGARSHSGSADGAEGEDDDSGSGVFVEGTGDLPACICAWDGSTREGGRNNKPKKGVAAPVDGDIYHQSIELGDGGTEVLRTRIGETEIDCTLVTSHPPPGQPPRPWYPCAQWTGDQHGGNKSVLVLLPPED